MIRIIFICGEYDISGNLSALFMLPTSNIISRIGLHVRIRTLKDNYTVGEEAILVKDIKEKAIPTFLFDYD